MSAIHTHPVFTQERAKYVRMWDEVEDYRKTSPGEALVGPTLVLLGLRPGMRIVDVGCGVGRAGLKFSQLMLMVTLLDATPDALDEEVKAAVADDDAPIIFKEENVWGNWPTRLDGPQDLDYCCDVLEHIPTEFAMLVVQRCLEAAPRALLHISTEHDGFGLAIGDTLHLTVKPFTWWRDRLADVGWLLEARDLLASGLFLLERA